MENDKYESWASNREACDFFRISSSTLRRWRKSSKVIFKRNPSGHYLYSIPSTTTSELSRCNSKGTNASSFIYCRVSSSKQKDDLNRQCKFLLDQYPNHSIIKDIGSGLNYKRPGLLKLLELSGQGNVKQIIVSTKDRLCRFGFELLQWFFIQNNTELVVLEQINKTREQEFTEDILAILQVFACRWNGSRKYSRKETSNEVEKNQIEGKQASKKTSL